MRSLEEAKAFLGRSAEPPTKLDLRSPAAAYRWMQSVRERHRREAEIRALSEIKKKMK